MKIYHNPRCSKSRETLALIRENNVEPEIIEYLNGELTVKELTEVLEILGVEPSEILRKGEKIYKENFKGKELSKEEWIEAMVANPKLIERPIVIKNKKAVLGRPPSNVLNLL